MTTTTQKIQEPAAGNSLAMIGTLGIISLVSGLLLALVYQGTLNTIIRNNEARTGIAVLDILPGAVKQKVFTALVPEDSGETYEHRIYAGYDISGKLVGVALEAIDNGGYGGEIMLLYGYLPSEQKISGMKVLISKETPGLGDRIKSDPAFHANFDGLEVPLSDDFKTLKHPISYAKPGSDKGPGQIEGISGATISSKAVARAMNASTSALLPVVHDMLDELKEGGK